MWRRGITPRRPRAVKMGALRRVPSWKTSYILSSPNFGTARYRMLSRPLSQRDMDASDPSTIVASSTPCRQMHLQITIASSGSLIRPVLTSRPKCVCTALSSRIRRRGMSTCRPCKQSLPSLTPRTSILSRLYVTGDKGYSPMPNGTSGRRSWQPSTTCTGSEPGRTVRFCCGSGIWLLISWFAKTILSPR